VQSRSDFLRSHPGFSSRSRYRVHDDVGSSAGVVMNGAIALMLYRTDRM